jgi:hypothetical protein
MALSKKHLTDVCYINGGTLQCRYFDEDFDDKGNAIGLCKKLSPDRSIIDAEIVDFINIMRRSGQDPSAQGVPLGDNCPGYVVLKTKLQGYDIK